MTTRHLSHPLLAFVAFAVSAFLCPSVRAQEPTLKVMLSDAGYAFNRYEELMTGVMCDSWKASASLKRSCKGEIKGIETNVQRAKGILQRASSESNPALVALFFIYEELNQIGGHLTELASSINDYTNDSGVPYAEAGAKTNILAAHLAEEIKARIIAAEEKLARCKH